MIENPSSPATQLSGLKLDEGWTVGTILERPQDATGGQFSIGYRASHPVHGDGFLKALDYSRAFGEENVAEVLQTMTEAFNFEVDIVRRCAIARLSRVALILASGQVHPPGATIPVSYMVFELAEGDVRAYLNASKTFDVAWGLRTLHQTASALRQLHQAGIAHQDTKASNLLTFPDGIKLADLGRAADRSRRAPHDILAVAGDKTYAPIELLYGEVPGSFEVRRVACDLFHLGSLILFFFTGSSMTPALVARLNETHRPDAWRGGYAAVLPYVRAALSQVLVELRTYLDGDLAGELPTIIGQLCDPEPERRGHPRARVAQYGDAYSLERYVSRLDVLARKAEAGLLRLLAA